jgi:hypothetical protein
MRINRIKQFRIMYTVDTAKHEAKCVYEWPSIRLNIAITASAADACASRSHTCLTAGLRALSASIRGSQALRGSCIESHIFSTLSASGCACSFRHLLTACLDTFRRSAQALSDGIEHAALYLSSNLIVAFMSHTH